MKTVLFDINRNELVTKQRFVVKNGIGYNYPDEEQWQKDRESGIRELVEVWDDQQEIDHTTQRLERRYYVDLEVENEFDGEYHIGWGVIDKSQEEIDDYNARKKERDNRKALEDELKSSSPIRPDLNNPDRVAELEKRIEKLEKLIL